MKNFVIGLSVGYLLTSLFSIPPPQLWFWSICGVSLFIVGAVGSVWYKLNDDFVDGEF